MTEKIEKQAINTELSEETTDLSRDLILINDDVHTFEYVIDALMDICNHTAQQAEQCAMITHYKGQCHIKKGKLNELKPLRRALVHRELNAIIK